MYPTPPSHENNNHVLSPMTNFEAPQDTTVTEGSGVCVKQESLLAEELAQVWGLNFDSFKKGTKEQYENMSRLVGTTMWFPNRSDINRPV